MKRILLFLGLSIAVMMTAWAATTGDVTGDGKTDVEDVNAVINVILKTDGAGYPGTTDINGDGKTDVEDVNRVINHILGVETPDGDLTDVGVYMGIVGFNQALYTKPVSLLNNYTKNDFTGFVNGLTSKNGTLLYWAVDNALNMLREAPTPKDLCNVVLVTFTDGLDHGSMMMNDRYATNEAYLSALHDHIKSTYKGLPLTAFSIGLRGNDVTDVGQFRSNLRQLASSDDNAYEVSDMNEVKARLQAIADRVTSVTRKQDISVTIPGQANGTRVRFTFDGVSDAANSSLYIEGTFQLSDCSLRNVTYAGMTVTSGSTIRGSQDGIFVTFKFTGLRRQSTGEILPTNNIRQWSYVSSSGQWQRNSEFTPESNTEVTVTNSSALVVLALDCSSSLGTQFSTMKGHANTFIETMAAAAPEPPVVDSETVTYTVNGVSFTMVGVQGGTFTMGATAEQGRYYDSDERPTHEVTLSSYRIGQTEVTQALWRAVMGSNPSEFYGGSYGTNLQRPVEKVSWEDCQAFITKLNQLTGQQFRLPTEAEWEYAARGGNKSQGYMFAGSNTVGDVAWYSNNSSSTTHAVGTKQANELGLYDMSGNVYEWCQDWYGSYSSDAQTNPTGPSSGSFRVSRGGSWTYLAEVSRVSSRNSDTPTGRYLDIGLRLAQ